MRRILFGFCVLLSCSTALGQNKLKGKVIDETGNSPLYGATISVSGKNVGTTDKDGTFSIDCSKGASITVSFVGYETYNGTIKNCDEDLNIHLTSTSQYLNNVEISATSVQNKSLLYQPSSITKLTTTELKRGNGLFLDDAINGNVPGVTMNRRAVSSGQQFNIRGYGNGSRGTRGVSSNFDGQGYKVYLNGIPVTDAEGISTLDDIDYGSVGTAEIVKGPAGTLYGLAIAGVVNLNTIKPEAGKTSIGQDILIGNYGLQRYTTHFEMGAEKSSLLVNYGHQKSDGFTIHNKSHKDFVNLAGSFQPNAKQSIDVYGGYSNSYDERSGELTIAQYESNDFSGNINYIRNNAHSQVYTVRTGISHSYTFNSHIANTTSVFGTGFTSNASSAGGWTDKAATNFGLRSTFNTKFTCKGGISLSGITGVETQRQNANSLGYSMQKNPKDTASVWVYGNPYYYVINATTSNFFTTTATTSVFTEWTLSLPKDFSVTAGVGLSNMKIGLDDRIYAVNKPTHFDTSYKGMLSPQVALNKVFNKNISVYAAYSKGYKAPVSSYFYIPYATGNSATGRVNSHLKAEIGNQFEIGTKGDLLKGKLNYQLALFDAVFSNKMTAVAVPNPDNTATLYTYMVNGGKQDNKGVEVLVRYVVYESSNGFFKSVTPYGNLTYSDFKYKNFSIESGTTPSNFTKVDYSGHVVPGVAKFLGNLGVDVATNPGLYATMSYFYKDGVAVTSNGTATGGTPSASNPLYHAGSYSLLNGKLGFRKGFGHFDLDLYFAVNNIAGTKYPIMIFVNQIPDAYVAGPKKANVFGGLNLKYYIK